VLTIVNVFVTTDGLEYIVIKSNAQVIVMEKDGAKVENVNATGDIKVNPAINTIVLTIAVEMEYV